MPWVYVCSDTMIDFNVEMAKKNRSFHKIPNIETKQCAYYENVDETSQNGHDFLHVCQRRICQQTACEPRKKQLVSR